MAAIIAIFFLIGILLFIILIKRNNSGSSDRRTYRPWIFEAPERRAGRIGEQRATNLISTVLRADDHLYTNVPISFEDKRTELDNVIVNKYGVFIIEVKNYNGTLEGNEEDFEWTKYHVSDAGNVYSKEVKNPIRQVKRQIYILAKYFESCYTARVWIEGYAILLHQNSPVVSEYILTDIQDIDRAIHTPGRNRLSQKDIEEICMMLSPAGILQ